ITKEKGVAQQQQQHHENKNTERERKRESGEEVDTVYNKRIFSTFSFTILFQSLTKQNHLLTQKWLHPNYRVNQRVLLDGTASIFRWFKMFS
ncbi:MAG: hypothetical protein ACYTX0_57290, partial [Nostoc sp.]